MPELVHVESWDGTPLEVRTFLGDGSGGFVAGPSLTFQAEPSVVRFADIDRDHRGDMTFVGYFEDGTRQVFVYRGDGTGAFLPPTTLPVPDDHPIIVAGAT